jgi:hypothetical protein
MNLQYIEDGIKGVTENLIKRTEFVILLYFVPFVAMSITEIAKEQQARITVLKNRADSYSHFIHVPFEEVQDLKSSGLSNLYLSVQLWILLS